MNTLVRLAGVRGPAQATLRACANTLAQYAQQPSSSALSELVDDSVQTTTNPNPGDTQASSSTCSTNHQPHHHTLLPPSNQLHGSHHAHPFTRATPCAGASLARAPLSHVSIRMMSTDDSKPPKAPSNQHIPSDITSTDSKQPTTTIHKAASNAEKPEPGASGALDVDKATGGTGMVQTVVQAARKALPATLLRLLPGNHRQGDDLTNTPSPPTSSAGTSSTSSSTAPASDDEKKKQELIDEFQRMANMDLAGYKEFNQAQLVGETEPPVQLPPVPMWHKDYRQFTDYKRVMYLRKKQHIDIIDCLTPDQMRDIEARGESVLEDYDLLSRVAQATRTRGREYMELEVLDCLKVYFETRTVGRRMLVWVRDLGQPMPADTRGRMKAEAAVQQLEARDWVMRRMEQCVGQDQCHLHHVRGAAGPLATCPHTQLPYRSCCGGRPLPIKYALTHIQLERRGLTPEHVEWKRAVAALAPQNTRLRRRPKPLNHVLPPREGAYRQTSHDKVLRMVMRKQLAPKVDVGPQDWK